MKRYGNQNFTCTIPIPVHAALQARAYAEGKTISQMFVLLVADRLGLDPQAFVDSMRKVKVTEPSRLNEIIYDPRTREMPKNVVDFGTYPQRAYSIYAAMLLPGAKFQDGTVIVESAGMRLSIEQARDKYGIPGI